MSCLDVIMFFWRYSWLFRAVTDSQKRTAIILILKLIIIIANYRMSSARALPPIPISQTDWTVVNKTTVQSADEHEETFEIIDMFSIEDNVKNVKENKQNGECNEHSPEKAITEVGNTNSVGGVLRCDKKESGE